MHRSLHCQQFDEGNLSKAKALMTRDFEEGQNLPLTGASVLPSRIEPFVAPTECAAPVALPGGLDFTMGTGRGYDLIKQSLAKEYPNFVNRAIRTAQLWTANSFIDSPFAFRFSVPQLGTFGKSIKAFIMAH